MLDTQEAERIRIRDEKIAYYKSEIKKFAPRIDEMLKVAIELRNNQIPLGVPIKDIACDKEPFVSDGIYHRLGFIDICRDGVRTWHNAIGIIGGGYCGNDFYVDCNGEIVECAIKHGMFSYLYDPVRDFMDKASQFICEFDDFEKRFYDYVDTL